ncbi:aldo/keto reductase [Paraburkholderia dipogonis]|uniref:Aldo/keto reductase n=1 Tax=Paraburkholderia dipogonis TaxID=1211383 RepID=A0A4Y8MHA5_9BURK|nr:MULTISPECIES: aldo/keto reductase [Paraburkholderia]TCK84070.1 D-threo-aldose 1-dehydrogenase [Paraburkholderia sp. BL9I2N2]TFE36798.1 aldo/keto reductase [Paraburkholderia dipogonis]
MAEYQERRVGTTNLNVSSIGLGTVPLAGFKTKVSYADFERVIDAAYAGGVRYFDAAPMYGFGKAEYYLGHALRELGIRGDVLVSTKVGRVLKPESRVAKMDSVYGIAWVDPLPFRDTYDYTYDGIMRSFEDSQCRLALDRIDVLFVHDLGRMWHGDANEKYMSQMRASGFRALDELRSSGAVGAVGLGVNETDSVVEVAREFRIDCSLIAGRYTLLNHAPLRGAFDELHERNVSVFAAGVFNSGILATGTQGQALTYDYQNVPAEIVQKVRDIENVCRKHGIELSAAAIQFVSMHPAVSTVLLGGQNVDEVRQNLHSTHTVAPAAFWDELKERGLIPQNAPTDVKVGFF